MFKEGLDKFRDGAFQRTVDDRYVNVRTAATVAVVGYGQAYMVEVETPAGKRAILASPQAHNTPAGHQALEDALLTYLEAVDRVPLFHIVD